MTGSSSGKEVAVYYASVVSQCGIYSAVGDFFCISNIWGCGLCKSCSESLCLHGAIVGAIA